MKCACTTEFIKGVGENGRMQGFAKHLIGILQCNLNQLKINARFNLAMDFIT